MKRIFDSFVSLIALIVLLPIFLLIAILIKLDSKGPVIFKQERIGKNSKPFIIYKFRTMVDKSSDESGITCAGDKRITKIGRGLRNRGLDELPQLFNVLIGDMSLVGPRPEVQSIVSYYTKEQKEVLTVKPGITGLAQISGENMEVNDINKKIAKKKYLEKIVPKKLRLDLQYLEKKSFFYDINILLKTAKIIITK